MNKSKSSSSSTRHDDAIFKIVLVMRRRDRDVAKRIFDKLSYSFSRSEEYDVRGSYMICTVCNIL